MNIYCCYYYSDEDINDTNPPLQSTHFPNFQHELFDFVKVSHLNNKKKKLVILFG
jgi:hypothetical protein